YRFSTANFKGSPRKLRFISKQIAGLPLDKAIVQMEFSPKRSSNKILHNLTFLRKNAQLQKDMDPKKMYIAQAWVGKGQYLKRVQPHSRGRHGIKHHPSAHMKFIVKEIEEQPDLGRAKRRNIHRFKETKKVWTSFGNNKPVYNPKPYYNW
ncbi:ribosomal protein L22, partial [Basidiobolus meristosporus CBS 931.73]